jgi:hypothetical protein
LYFLFFSLIVTFHNSEALDDVQKEGMVDLDNFSVFAAPQVFKVSVALRSLYGDCSDKIFRGNQQPHFEV